jgi:hypothetical protein
LTVQQRGKGHGADSNSDSAEKVAAGYALQLFQCLLAHGVALVNRE